MPEFPALTELLPHRPPMLLLHRVLTHAAGETVCEAMFDAEFARYCCSTNAEAAVPAAFCLELIAQTMAVHDGLLRRAEGRPRATRGLLLGSRRFELHAPALPIATPLRVIARGQLNDAAVASAGLVRFDGRVESADGATLYARGDVTVLEHRPRPEPAPAVLLA
ncbi:MAG: hypothetical protein JO117_08670 [Verrucomicrobia bacterium]|nr:hypothetical protein [Verrucomicrobiota bacterium]